MRSFCIGFIAMTLVTATPSLGQVIGIYFDQNAQTTVADIPVNTAAQFYIIGRLGGGLDMGMTVCEFRVIGMPAEWMLNVTPNPGMNVILGDPFSSVGTASAFPSCQLQTLIVLFTVDVLATTSVPNVQLSVVARNPPGNPNYPCPLMTRCAPNYELVCCTGGQAVINPVVSATPSTWTRIKTLYGD